MTHQPVVVTVTETVPVPAGTLTVRLVPLATVTEVPALVPKSTAVEPETKPVPVTVTVLPPAWGPLFGLTSVTVGAPGVVGELVIGALIAEVPLGVVTVTSTVPVPAGEVTVRLVAVTPLIEVPGLVPKWTAVAPVKLVPLTVTEVPPAAGPLWG